MKRTFAFVALVGSAWSAAASTAPPPCQDLASTVPMIQAAKNYGLKEDWLAASITSDTHSSLADKVVRLSILYDIYEGSGKETTAAMMKRVTDTCAATLPVR